MAPTLPCRFFALGKCNNGSKCTFSHETGKAVCEFYLQGNCRFGNYCQFKHERAKKKEQVTLKPLPKCQVVISQKKVEGVNTGLCPLHVTGNCEKKHCKYTHGVACPVCNKNCLDPNDSPSHALHIQKCKDEKRKQEISKDKECVVCFEIVKQKKDPRFGLLDCGHCVCLECIRTWRETEKVDTSKTCPICRTVTHAVVPSLIWPETKSEKETIVKEYRQKLSNIDCKHYKKGKGTCPFSTSCFYRHVDEHGISEKERLRIISNGDFDEEGLQVMKQMSLADYL